MKAYKVITANHRRDIETILFSSKDKALGYIFNVVSMDKVISAHEKRNDWWNGTWEYDVEKLFSTKNWNKYEYVTNSGITTLRIEEVTIY